MDRLAGADLIAQFLPGEVRQRIVRRKLIGPRLFGVEVNGLRLKASNGLLQRLPVIHNHQRLWRRKVQQAGGAAVKVWEVKLHGREGRFSRQIARIRQGRGHIQRWIRLLSEPVTQFGEYTWAEFRQRLTGGRDDQALQRRGAALGSGIKAANALDLVAEEFDPCWLRGADRKMSTTPPRRANVPASTTMLVGV